MSSRREWIRWAGLGAASLGVIGRAWAAPFPEKPIKLIVPYPAGGGADQWAIIVGGKAEELLGQPIVFDYKPGASTTIGADAAAKAPAACTNWSHTRSGRLFCQTLRNPTRCSHHCRTRL